MAKAKQKSTAELKDLRAQLEIEVNEAQQDLSEKKYSVNLELPSMESKILGSIHYWMEFFRYDPIWSLARRKNTAHLNPKLSKEKFYERLSGFYASCEDLEVGQYIRAQDKDEKPRYLRIAGKLITGDGQITWLFKGATKDMSEDILRVSAGTPEKPSGLDSYSHYLTDLEMEIGKMGYESGLPYHKDMQLLIDRPVIEIGYSIGGVFAQYRAVDEFSNVKELWTFKSPGVPLKVINEFENEKSEKVFFPIYVYIAKKDFVSSLGGRHLGCANVDNLDVHVVEMTIPKILPHRYYEDTFERVQMTLLPGGPIALEKYYSNSKIENFRQKSAKYVARPFLMTIGAGWRKVMPNRLKKKRGLWYEVLDNGCHSVCHIVV